ncbi:hypothetical protein Tco_0161291, partial [Tanacetum coccineum]
MDNQTNPHAGTSEVTNSADSLPTPNANAFEEEDIVEELIVVPTVVKHTTTKVGPRMSSTNSKAEEFLTELQNLKTQEKEAYSTGITEDTPTILAFRKELDELAQKHLRELTIFNTPQKGIFDEASYDEEGYRWMFDIDYLTDSMNYILVSLENQTNPHAGTSEVTNSAETLPTPNVNASEEEDAAEELIVVPVTVKHTAAQVGPRMS